MNTAGPKCRPCFFVAALCVVLGLFHAAIASAGTFMANPVRLTVAPGAMSTSLQLENQGAEPVLIQAQVMAWSQAEGKDVLTPSDDLVVSPPIFKVAPGATQIVRVGLLRPNTTDREVTYRLFLQEVVQAAPGQQGVSVALRLGLPVFVLPKATVAARPVWRARPEGGDIVLTLANQGNAHVQALEAKIAADDGALLAEEQLAAYVLAGQARSWRIKPAKPWRGGSLKLTAQMSTGNVSADLRAE